MKRLPCLLPLTAKRPTTPTAWCSPCTRRSVPTVCSASIPDDKRKAIRSKPLVKHLLAVARQGVHVSALIDLFDDDSYLVEIPAYERPTDGDPLRVEAAHECAAGVGRISAPHAPSISVFDRSVLAFEGHGAGYLPEIDALGRLPPDSSQRQRNAWSGN